MSINKILAVASIGGHWIQLLRIAKGLEADFDVVYCSTHEKCATMVLGHTFHKIDDFSRWNAWKLPFALWKLIRIIRQEKPSAGFTTGAAPGLTALLAAKLCRVKTIWIDSVANVETLSASGKMARRFADRVYTQWENLSDNDRIMYAGNIFG